MTNPTAGNSRNALLPLILSAVFVLVGVALLCRTPPALPRTDASASPTPEASPSSVSVSAKPNHPGRPSEAASGVPVPGDGSAGDYAVQLLLSRSSPADLPRQLERRLVQLASHVWHADVTGRGQEQWRDYFAAGRTRSAGVRDVYTHVRIQAGIARKEHHGRVEVRLVWAAADPSGEMRDGRTGRLVLRPSPNHPTRWEPVR